MTRTNTLTKLLCAVLVLCGLLCCAGAAGAEGDCAHVFADGACTACGVTGGYCGASTNEGGEQSVIWTLSDNHLVSPARARWWIRTTKICPGGIRIKPSPT